MNKPEFSIIIPALYEDYRINTTIEYAQKLNNNNNCEIIVVDGDSKGSTINTITDKSVRKIHSPPIRAQQMNAGAAIATGRILIFLHTDTILPENALEHIKEALDEAYYMGGAFSLGIRSTSRLMKYIEITANLRSKFLKMPYGDQGFFIRKRYFDKIGGFKKISQMEDIELIRRIKKKGDRICIMPEKVQTSARRWQKQGIIFATLKNFFIVSLFHLGVSAEKLVKYYQIHRKDEPEKAL